MRSEATGRGIATPEFAPIVKERRPWERPGISSRSSYDLGDMPVLFYVVRLRESAVPRAMLIGAGRSMLQHHPGRTS